jgi:hypothetical protein
MVQQISLRKRLAMIAVAAVVALAMFVPLQSFAAESGPYITIGDKVAYNNSALYFSAAVAKSKIKAPDGYTLTVIDSLNQGAVVTGNLPVNGAYVVMAVQASPLDVIIVPVYTGNTKPLAEMAVTGSGTQNATVQLSLSNAADLALAPFDYYEYRVGTTGDWIRIVAEAGVTDVDFEIPYIAGGVNNTYYFRAVNKAGVVGAAKSQKIVVDREAPVITVEPAPLENGFTAYPAAVTFTFNEKVTAYSEDGSVIVADNTKVKISESTTLAYVVDAAGNRFDVNKTINIDTTKPGMSLGATRNGKAIGSNKVARDAQDVVFKLTMAANSATSQLYYEISVDDGAWTKIVPDENNEAFYTVTKTTPGISFKFRPINSATGAAGQTKTFIFLPPTEWPDGVKGWLPVGNNGTANLYGYEYLADDALINYLTDGQANAITGIYVDVNATVNGGLFKYAGTAGNKRFEGFLFHSTYANGKTLNLNDVTTELRSSSIYFPDSVGASNVTVNIDGGSYTGREGTFNSIIAIGNASSGNTINVNGATLRFAGEGSNDPLLVYLKGTNNTVNFTNCTFVINGAQVTSIGKYITLQGSGNKVTVNGSTVKRN